MRAAGLVAALLAFAGFVALVRPAHGAYRGRNGAIVFERGDDLYTLRPADGKVLRRLTENEGLNTSPTWSPSGKQIAFASDRNTRENDIYVMNADGSGQSDIAAPRRRRLPQPVVVTKRRAHRLRPGPQRRGG